MFAALIVKAVFPVCACVSAAVRAAADQNLGQLLPAADLQPASAPGSFTETEPSRSNMAAAGALDGLKDN